MNSPTNTNQPYSQSGEKGTDTNQASEDEQTKAIYEAMQIPYLSERHDAIKDIIRSEKLKLLAEVRERAIPNPTTPAGDNEFVPLDELTKLEAEL